MRSYDDEEGGTAKAIKRRKLESLKKRKEREALRELKHYDPPKEEYPYKHSDY